MMSNVLAALGAALIVTAIIGLAGLWWGILAAGVFLLASAYALHTQSATQVIRVMDAESPPTLRAVA